MVVAILSVGCGTLVTSSVNNGVQSDFLKIGNSSPYHPFKADVIINAHALFFADVFIGGDKSYPVSFREGIRHGSYGFFGKAV